MSDTDPRSPIHSVIRCAEFAEDVELIDIHVAGNDFVLLRSKKMPEFAFMLWTTELTTTMSQMSFRYSGGRRSFDYSVVCACCPSELKNQKKPSEVEKECEEWKKAEAMKFKEALLEACRQNSITKVFMRCAGFWNGHYGNIAGVVIVEASEYWKTYNETYGEFYGRRTIRESLRFIHEASKGLGF